jgi:hypothetical protein
MAAPLAIDLVETVLALHVGLILFNIFGLVAVPLGAWRGWHFVRVAWWRFLHLVALTVVAVQALLGRACFLTLWQDDLRGVSGKVMPLIMGWVDQVIYWHLPFWFFEVIYVLVWIYVLALLWLVPPEWRRHERSRERPW